MDSLAPVPPQTRASTPTPTPASLRCRICPSASRACAVASLVICATALSCPPAVCGYAPNDAFAVRTRAMGRGKIPTLRPRVLAAPSYAGREWTMLFDQVSDDGGVGEAAAADDSSSGRSPTDDFALKQQNQQQRGGGRCVGAADPADPRAASEEGATGPANGTSGEADTAPEVNKWTTIMADGTNAAFHKKRPGRREKMTSEEAMEILYDDLSDMSPFDDEQVELYWDKIMPTVSYLGTEAVAKVKQALRVAYRAHRAQKRKSGEPFIIHPVEVALLLSGLKMDGETVMSGLLHDTVEDTDLTFTQVEAMFGKTVRTIVEGETKVSKLPKLVFNDYADEQAENLRQMFVAMTEDYRIIIVKLADRLHNMRTLRHMKPEKQVKISRETLDIFAPLAHRMGIWQFKSELEDTAFMYLYPREYKKVNRKLRRHQTKFRLTLDRSKEILERTLNDDPTLRAQATSIKVYGRTKELYSLWHKMETKADHDLDHIADVVALRVIIEPKEPTLNGDAAANENVADRGVWLCYHVLGLVQHLPGFQPLPTRVKDYISFPKPNGYQSLHTALMLSGQKVEVQIRTAAMHQVAEYGMASHWAYTDSKRRNEELYSTPWLSSIKEWQDDVVCSRDFVDCVRRELLGKRVFVFLRNGKILNLARGATVIDAAFQIHTEVGLKMHGAEINGKPVPFAYELQNGDVVSILTGKGKPATDWMRYAKSRSTRSKLRSYFRSKQKDSLREAGEILLLDFLAVHKDLIESSSLLEESVAVPEDSADLNALLPGQTKYKDADELLVAVGKSHSRAFLRGVVSKMFKVPLSLFVEAEEVNKGSTAGKNIAVAVLESRKMAKDAAAAAREVERSDMSPLDPVNGSDDKICIKDVNGETAPETYEDFSIDVILGGDDDTEVADPEHLCADCLPVFGDDIVGTRPRGKTEDDMVAAVHRRSCPHAHRALLRSAASFKGGRNGEQTESEWKDAQNANGVRVRTSSRFGNHGASSDESKQDEVPVALQWQEGETEDYQVFDYFAEVVVVAEDRKLLLADCSEVVSELSEIARTGSSTTNEHATLEFLVRVKGVEELQTLMDGLRDIESVMSVERKFGSDLMR